jgi:hypothetical protein
MKFFGGRGNRPDQTEGNIVEEYPEHFEPPTLYLVAEMLNPPFPIALRPIQFEIRTKNKKKTSK